MNYIDRFDKTTTSLQVLHNSNLKDAIYLITGSSNGIGFETARYLCLHGAKVILCGSSERSTTDAVIRLKSLVVDSQVYYVTLNLNSLKDVHKAATEIVNKFTKLDGLILNAGISSSNYEVSADGLEKTFQVNFLSQFYLTLLLKDLLVENSRVVIVSSNFYRNSNLTRHNISANLLNSSGSGVFDSYMPYATSKLCNILHAKELSRKLSSKGVLVFSCHPGVARTNIYQGWIAHLMYFLYNWRTKTLSQAAASVLYAATSQDIVNHSGCYIVDCCISKPVTSAANDDVLAQKLWQAALNILENAGCSLGA